MTPPTAHRFFIVGTDTAVGKTHALEALLRAAVERKLRALPFKPAQSGDDHPSDVERLIRASALPLAPADICVHFYDAPVAPGVADDLSGLLGRAPPDEQALAPARQRLEALEARIRPDLVFVEGAGGYHVPMPGRLWLRHYIDALAPRVLIVGRAGLGTINHTLLTIEALRRNGHDPVGFVHNHADTSADPSVRHNAAIIEAHGGVPHLGTFPNERPDGPDTRRIAAQILERLLA